MRRLLIISAIIVGIGIAYYGFTVERNRGSAPESTVTVQKPHVGVQAPDFTLTDMDGRSVTLSKYRGKVVMLNFWATWCPPCRAEVPSIEKLYRRMQGKDFALLAVNVENNGRDSVAAFAKEIPISFPVLLDPDHRVTTLYQVNGIPQTYILDKNGVIVQDVQGGVDWTSPQVVAYLSSLMKGE